MQALDIPSSKPSSFRCIYKELPILDNTYLKQGDGLVSWILTNPNPRPAITLIARGWMSFDNVEPYLDFNYTALVIDNVDPVSSSVGLPAVQVKLVDGASGGAGETRRWDFDNIGKAHCWGFWWFACR